MLLHVPFVRAGHPLCPCLNPKGPTLSMTCRPNIPLASSLTLASLASTFSHSATCQRRRQLTCKRKAAAEVRLRCAIAAAGPNSGVQSQEATGPGRGVEGSSLSGEDQEGGWSKPPSAASSPDEPRASGGVTVDEAETAARRGIGDEEADALLARLKRRVPAQRRRGAQLAEFLFLFGGLLDRPFGNAHSIAAAGNVVVSKCQAEAEAMAAEGGEAGDAAAQEGGDDPQLVFELLRVLRLLSADCQLIAAAKRQETLLARLDSAKANCKLAIQLANAL